MQKKFQEVTHEIESSILDRCINFSAKTEMYVRRLFDQFGFDQVFGRSAVMERENTNLKDSINEKPDIEMKNWTLK